MANWLKPVLTDLYTNVLDWLKARDTDLAKGLDPATVTVENPQAGFIRYSSANRRWEKCDGTSWAPLQASYAINADTASKWLAARSVSITGDLAWSVSIDGAGNATGIGTLANSGVSAGTFNNAATAISPFTVDAKGRITSIGAAVTITPAWASIIGKPTTLGGFGITDAVPAAGGTMTGALLNAAGCSNPSSPANFALRAQGGHGGGLSFTDGDKGIAMYSIGGTLTFAFGSNAAISGKATLDAAGNFYAAGTLTGAAARLTGDITVYRSSAPGTGVLFLGDSGARYLYYDGSNYSMPGANLWVNGQQVVTNNGATWGISIGGNAVTATNAGRAAIADNADAVGGYPAAQLLRADQINFNASDIGYHMAPPDAAGRRIVFQWGYFGAYDGDQNITFPLAFPHRCFGVFESSKGGSAWPEVSKRYIFNITQSGFTASIGGIGMTEGKWIAIGY